MEDESKKELQELISKFKPTVKYQAITVFVFFVISAILIFVKALDIHLMLPILLLVWTFEQFLPYLFLKISKTASGLRRFLFAQFAFDIFFLTVVVYYIGAIEWVSPIFYIFTIIYAIHFMDTEFKRYFFVFLSFAFFAALVLLEFFEIIPFEGIIAPSGFNQNLPFVIATLVVTLGAFVLIASVVNYFAGRLREKTDQLTAANIGLEGAVQKRTEELEKIKSNLEGIVKQRTEELQKKVNELERFYKLAVGREMRVIELKKQLAESKKGRRVKK